MNREQSEAWRDRMTALGWKAETFLVMARMLASLVHDLTPQRLSGAGKRLGSEVFKTTDWDQAYRSRPTVLGQLTTGLNPRLMEEPPTKDRLGWGEWARDTFTQLDATMKRLDKGTDPKTGYFTEDAMQRPELKAVVAHAEKQVEAMVVELKVTADDLASLMQTGQPMAIWLTAALEGDRKALQMVLSLNPWLSYHLGIARHLQEATVAQDHAFLAGIAQGLKQEGTPRKHAMVALILATLWEAGLYKLTYKQLRGFLKSAGLEGVPTHQALEKYAQRLGLRKYVRDGDPANREHENANPHR